ncbi:SF0329 family protein [Photobacterium nomapromontoriensis]|uniref:SF0329 family protein n=1 Tax=Photobacterium nomapromontoriensis TaxID=2910237 RepID=UPI003D11EC4D
MSRPWSKLQKELYLLRADGLDLQIQCRVFRMKSQRGSTDCPRYWITLNKETIWDYPRDFTGTAHPEREEPGLYPYLNDVSAISSLIRDYIDTPRDALLNRQFDHDYWGLTDILRAADRRIGTRRLGALGECDTAAAKVVAARLGTA